MTGKKRYYIDWERGTEPSLQVVYPGDDDYEFAEPTFSAAKKKLISLMRERINYQRHLLKEMRQLRASDVEQGRGPSEVCADEDEGEG